MKKIAILKLEAKNPGGLEKYASRIAAAFTEKGDSVTLLSKDSSIWKWPAFQRIEQFDQFVQKWVGANKPDVVFGMDRNRRQTHLRAGNGVHAAFLESRIHTEGRLKYLSCQINPLHRKILQIEKAAFEDPDLQKLFVNSHMVKTQILERFATDSTKIQVIHNGVEWKEMQTPFDLWEEKRPEHLKKWGLDPHQFQFLFIGNGYLRKGLKALLEAIAQIKNADFQLSILGQDKNIEFFRSLILQYNLSDKVRFFGPTKEVLSFYQMADALVIPSFYDPFANVTIEALAMGLFVVSSRQNGGHEILSSKNGVVIEDLLDPASIALALKKALQRKKTRPSSLSIRKSVQHLDFSSQLKILTDACY